MWSNCSEGRNPVCQFTGVCRHAEAANGPPLTPRVGTFTQSGAIIFKLLLGTSFESHQKPFQWTLSSACGPVQCQRQQTSKDESSCENHHWVIHQWPAKQSCLDHSKMTVDDVEETIFCLATETNRFRATRQCSDGWTHEFCWRCTAVLPVSGKELNHHSNKVNLHFATMNGMHQLRLLLSFPRFQHQTIKKVTFGSVC